MDTNDDALFAVEAAEERKCAGCGVVRPLAMFYVAAEQRQQAKTGNRVRRICRLCVQAKNQARLAPRYEIIARIKAEAGCADCGIKNPDHPEIFDFDHLPGHEKTAGVSAFLTKGTVDELLAEIAKCEVVCSNCHRIRTWSRRQIHWFGRDRGAEVSRRYPPKHADPTMR